MDGAHVTVDSTGAVERVTGGSAVGQGFATAMAQICGGTTQSPARDVFLLRMIPFVERN